MIKETRREFIKKLGILGVGISVIPAWIEKIFAQVIPKGNSKKYKSKVVIVKNKEVVNSKGKIEQEILTKMLNEAMRQLTGLKEIKDCWNQYFSHNDIVGIKVNCIAGRKLSTHPELVNAIISGLLLAGVKEDNIIIYDRGTQELSKANFKINKNGSGIKCYGNDAVGYEFYPTMIRSVGCCFSKILSTQVTAIINVPVLKDHELTGVSLSLKNHFGSINNPNKYHGNNGDPYIADLNSHPLIKDKTRLIICDAITGLYNGGPGYKKQWTWHYRGILVSTDPVALDYIGTQEIEKMRKAKKMKPLEDVGRPPKHIATAAKLGLGTDNPQEIEVIRKRSGV
ncbi:MAG: DUF362 domain-containing protein [bacterium]